MATDARAWLALTCRRDGTITQVLRDDLRLAGKGARFPDIVDSGSRQKAEAFLAAAAERGCVVEWQLNVPVDEGARPLHFAGAASGDTLLILGAPGFDTLRFDNHLYEELSRLNNKLINRERELARNSAALARTAAEKARVVAIAAHDLRNPLTVIAAYADLLKADAVLDEEHQSFVEEIGQSARFMMELVEEMLETSRTESGQVELDLQDVDLVTAASHAATISRLRAERKQIAIAFEQETERVLIHADPVKLRQILNNLTVNAIKFSPSGTRVTIRVRRDATHALVEVEDHGIGIPREHLRSIFEPFRTLAPSGTAGEVSTGLGLAIVQQLVTLHGGTVQVESEVGRGSCFRVAFPIA